jgi:HEAT repeat protein
MRKTLGMNRHQKAAHKAGEKRLGPDEIPELLEMSRSEDPEARLVAAQYLCPCHVRRRIETVWEALYRLLEDPDVRVRRAAWHTLEDGGRPQDPVMDDILKRILESEKDPQVRRFAEEFAGPRAQQERLTATLAARPLPKRRGRCDFCGASDVFVDRDLETMIPADGFPRAAWICEQCKKSE